MDLHDLAVFKVFYEFRNLNEVARRCNLSQPTVSYRLKKIEQLLQTKLYTYDGKYHFTENGIRFYDFCKISVREYDQFKSHLVRQSEVHISLSSVATYYYMETVFELVWNAGSYPVISTTSSSEAIRNVADGHSAFAVVGGIEDTQLTTQLDKKRISDEEIVLIYNSKLLEDLKYIPIVLDDHESGLNSLAVTYLKQHPEYSIIGEIGKPFDKLPLAAKYPIGIFVPADYARYVKNNHRDEIRISTKYRFSRQLYVVFPQGKYPQFAAELIEKINKAASSIK